MKFTSLAIEVDAYTIIAVGALRDDKSRLVTIDKEEVTEEVTVTESMMSRMTPKVGDYLVVTKDGYEYLNPKDVFESKYVPSSDVVSEDELNDSIENSFGNIVAKDAEKENTDTQQAEPPCDVATDTEQENSVYDGDKVESEDKVG